MPSDVPSLRPETWEDPNDAYTTPPTRGQTEFPSSAPTLDVNLNQTSSAEILMDRETIAVFEKTCAEKFLPDFVPLIYPGELKDLKCTILSQNRLEARNLEESADVTYSIQGIQLLIQIYTSSTLPDGFNFLELMSRVFELFGSELEKQLADASAFFAPSRDSDVDEQPRNAAPLVDSENMEQGAPTIKWSVVGGSIAAGVVLALAISFFLLKKQKKRELLPQFSIAKSKSRSGASPADSLSPLLLSVASTNFENDHNTAAREYPNMEQITPVTGNEETLASVRSSLFDQNIDQQQNAGNQEVLKGPVSHLEIPPPATVGGNLISFDVASEISPASDYKDFCGFANLTCQPKDHDSIIAAKCETQTTKDESLMRDESSMLDMQVAVADVVSHMERRDMSQQLELEGLALIGSKSSGNTSSKRLRFLTKMKQTSNASNMQSQKYVSDEETEFQSAPPSPEDQVRIVGFDTNPNIDPPGEKAISSPASRRSRYENALSVISGSAPTPKQTNQSSPAKNRSNVFR
jgi:hypothetical protein